MMRDVVGLCEINQALRCFLWLALTLCLIRPTHENSHGCPTPCTCNILRMDQEEPVVYVFCQNRDIDTVLPDYRSLRKWKKVDKILVDSNYVRTIAPKSFNGLNIRVISLESNPLSYVHPDAFAGTHGLTDLNFNECNLTSVPDIFKHIPDIQTLELRGNNIMQINRGIFEPILNLRYIDISNNQIANLDFIVDKCSYRKAFTSILLSNNPLKCTCDAYELVKSKTVQLIDGVCASPPLFRDMYIGTGTALDDDEEDRESFMQSARHVCNDNCPSSSLTFDCANNIWTNGDDTNCYKRPLCVNNKLKCPEGSTATVVGSTDPVNYTEPDDDDDYESDSKNGTIRKKKRPTYLMEKMRFQHGETSGASRVLFTVNHVNCLILIITAVTYNTIRRVL